MTECNDPRRTTLATYFPTLALDHDTNALDFPTLERTIPTLERTIPTHSHTIPTQSHSSLMLECSICAHTLDYPTLAYDLSAHAPNHAHTTTTRSRCARDSVTRTVQCQDRGAHKPRS